MEGKHRLSAETIFKNDSYLYQHFQTNLFLVQCNISHAQMDSFWGLSKKSGCKPQLTQLLLGKTESFNDAYRSDYPNFQRTKMKDKAETTVALRGHKHYCICEERSKYLR